MSKSKSLWSRHFRQPGGNSSENDVGTNDEVTADWTPYEASAYLFPLSDNWKLQRFSDLSGVPATILLFDLT